MATSNVSLTSDWASLSDYISVDAFNKLKTDIVNVAESRGMMVNNNGTIKNTLTNANVTVPANKTAGEKVLLSDVTDLQKLAKDTVAYHKGSTSYNADNSVKSSSYTYKNPVTMGKPLALLYNEVRQVVVDMYSGAGCANSCSTSCKSGCSQTCYNACTTGCTDGNCVGSCGTTCTSSCSSSCSSSCGSNCTSSCTGSGCTMSCGNSCSSSCGSNCSTTCITTCSGGCINSCNNTCGNSCSSTCTTTCTASCNNACTSTCANSCKDKTCGANGCTGTCSNANSKSQTTTTSCATSSACASSYDSCSSCSGQCVSNCLFNSCKDRSAGNTDTTCGRYGCYAGGCYLTCVLGNCAGNCYAACKGTCESESGALKPSCIRICSNSSESMYTTCAGLATSYFLFKRYLSIILNCNGLGGLKK